MKTLRTISVVLIAVAAAGILLQCGAPADLLGTVEKKVEEASAGDILSPSVEIRSPAGTGTWSLPIQFIVTFSEPVTRFDEGDLNITVDSGSFSVSAFGSNIEGNEYTFEVTPDSDPAMITVDIPADVAVDEEGNSNTAIDQPHSVLYDTRLLTVSIDSNITSPTNISPVELAIEFSQEVSNFVSGDIDIGNGWYVENFDDSNNPIFIVDIAAGNDGLVTVDIPAAVATTVSTGRNNQEAQQYDFTYDGTAPGVPVVEGVSSPTGDDTPEWTWNSGGGGNGTYRFKLDDNDFTSDATTTTEKTFIPGLELSDGNHTLFVQERDDVGNWSDSGDYSITVEHYSVTYYPNGGNGGSVPTDSTEYHSGDEATVEGNTGDLTTTETQDGITLVFKDWNTLSNGEGDSYSAASTIPELSSSIDLYAQWTVIGGTGPAGGFVFYDDEEDGVDDISGYRYLEAAPKSTEWSDKEWGVMNGTADTVGWVVGTGTQNTENIVTWLDNNTDNNHGDVTSKEDRAAYLCFQLSEGGSSEWFLPSTDELILMYDNLYKKGRGDFVTTDGSSGYWSSVENSSTSSSIVQFRDSFRMVGDVGKDGKNLVRAIRAFN